MPVILRKCKANLRAECGDYADNLRIPGYGCSAPASPRLLLDAGALGV